MEKSLAMRILAVLLVIVAFLYSATQGQLIEIGLALGAALTASVGIWLMPPTDSDVNKLRDHLLLSTPLAALSVVTGAVVLYTDGVVNFASWMALVLALLVPASVLEQRLMATNP
jgi:hypothetical protein